MNEKLIPHIFGSLIALERSVKLIEKHQLDSGTDSLAEIVLEMRKAANLIQLQFARNDIVNAYRSLNVFYGLLTMIRPIVVETLKEASGEPTEEKKAVNLH